MLIGNVRKLQKITDGDMKDEIIELGQLLSEIANEYETPGTGVNNKPGMHRPLLC